MLERIPVYYGKKDEGCRYLEKSASRFIVGSTPDAAEAIRERVQDTLSSCRIKPEASLLPGFQVFSASGCSTAEMTQFIETIRTWPGVDCAARALIDESTGLAPWYSGHLFVKFAASVPAQTAQDTLQRCGLIDIAATVYSDNGFIARVAGTPRAVFDVALDLVQRDDVIYATPEVCWECDRSASVRNTSRIGRHPVHATRRPQTAVVSDRATDVSAPRTLAAVNIGELVHPKQWHLKKTLYDADTLVDASAHVVDAHAISVGAKVVVAILDDAFDIDHPEFLIADKLVDPQAFYSPLRQDDDVRPTDPLMSHGTAVAGVALAAGVHGACGVAPAAQLMPIKLPGIIGSLAEAAAFAWAADHGASIISCSWGPPDGNPANATDRLHYARSAPMPAHTREAIAYAATAGRNNVGCAIFFAAGNGNEQADLDAYANHPAVFAIGACNEHGERSQYSDFGNNVLCVFPSSDLAPFLPRSDAAKTLRTTGIWTTAITRTDLSVWNAAYAKQDSTFDPDDIHLIHRNKATAFYTATFGGTSSATPGAAGVAALVMSVVPDITLAELRRLLICACDRIDPSGSATNGIVYDRNGHSPYYGYGRLNAFRAVQLAQSLRPLRPAPTPDATPLTSR